MKHSLIRCGLQTQGPQAQPSTQPRPQDPTMPQALSGTTGVHWWFLQAIKLVKRKPTLPSIKLLYHEITDLVSPSSFIPLPGAKHSEIDRRGCVTVRPTRSGQGQRKALDAWQKGWRGLPACFYYKTSNTLLNMWSRIYSNRKSWKKQTEATQK